MLEHKHLIVNAEVLNPPKDEDKLKELMVNIIESIGMKVAKLSGNQPNPISWYCDDPDNQGMTGTGILTTSHMAMHFWDVNEPYVMKFDLYSCSKFDPMFVIKILHQEFKITKGTAELKDRDDQVRAKRWILRFDTDGRVV